MSVRPSLADGRTRDAADRPRESQRRMSTHEGRAFPVVTILPANLPEDRQEESDHRGGRDDGGHCWTQQFAEEPEEGEEYQSGEDMGDESSDHR